MENKPHLMLSIALLEGMHMVQHTRITKVFKNGIITSSVQFVHNYDYQRSSPVVPCVSHYTFYHVWEKDISLLDHVKPFPARSNTCCILPS